MKKSRLLFAIPCLLAISCSKQTSSTLSEEEGSIPIRSAYYTAPNGARMIFKTDFDNTTVAAGDANGTDITGSNIAGYAWNMTDFNFGSAFGIQYLGGNNTIRKAVVNSESGNNVLNFIMSGVTQPTTNPPKSRIQANLYGFRNPTDNQPFKEVYQTVRVRLDYNSFHKIRLDHSRLIKPTDVDPTDSRDWLTLFEFWNNNDWDATNSGTSPGASIKYPFRISLNIQKRVITNSSGQTTYETGATPDQLVFEIHGQKSKSSTDPSWDKTSGGQDAYVWKETPSFTIPLGTWMTIECYMKEGTESTGKFWATVQPDGMAKTVLCNKTGRTFSPYDNNPNGFSEINPMKLYTSANIINMVKGTANNTISRDLIVTWDNLRIYDKMPY